MHASECLFKKCPVLRTNKLHFWLCLCLVLSWTILQIDKYQIRQIQNFVAFWYLVLKIPFICNSSVWSVCVSARLVGLCEHRAVIPRPCLRTLHTVLPESHHYEWRGRLGGLSLLNVVDGKLKAAVVFWLTLQYRNTPSLVCLKVSRSYESIVVFL